MTGGAMDGMFKPMNYKINKEDPKNLEAKINFKYGDVFWDVLQKLGDYALTTPNERDKVGKFVKEQLNNRGNGFYYDAIIDKLVKDYKDKKEGPRYKRHEVKED